MDKTSEKVEKDPKRVGTGHKGRKNFMNKPKEDILNDTKKGRGDTTNTSNKITNPTNNVSNETTTPATSTYNTTTTKSNNTYVYGVGILSVLAIGTFVFFAYNTFPKNKKLVNEKQDQPPKRRHML